MQSLIFPKGVDELGLWSLDRGVLSSSLGIMNTMGSFEEYISTHQLKDLDVSMVAWIFNLYAFMTFGVGLFVGPLFDKYGPKWLVLSGSVLVVLSMDLIGICTSW
jgi:MFS family permease